MAVIEVDDLHKSYGDVEAVRGVSFAVEEGEVLAVLGPNGAGKTTTVEILEGYLPRNSGTVAVLGTDPATGGAAFRQRIGIVLQECGVDPYLSVSEILKMHAGYYPSPRPVDEVIELVGLGEKVDARIKTLSGGQRRRLDVALGMIGDPDLLFLDEPTTGFDPTARRQAWDVVRNLTALGKTVLLTTHYMDEAQALADRVVVIASGRIVAEGTPDSIGGRDDADSTIRFVLPAGVAPSDLPVAVVADPDAGAGADASGGTAVRVSSAEPTRTLHALTSWAVDLGIELDHLSVSQPSLEDVYLSLTADDADAPGAAR